MIKKRKEWIAITLVLIAIGLWAKLLFFNQKQKRSVKQVKKTVKQVEQSKPKEPISFVVTKLYKRIPVRNSPFLSGQQNQAEFNYQSPVSNQSPKSLNKESKKQPKVLILTIDLEVTGLLKRKNHYLAVVQDKNRSYLLAPKDIIKGYQVVKITNKEVKLKKDGRSYLLKFNLANY
ncbi:hypothetical protein Halha_0525 [Halobacteroides halobius DSM 5150]|uniref:Uncharacterized protein n=1 Tax=Halobacteroides halobius (strain ATCC 35273 / DSM 5150 / MD-1) TaxID=748449 RepID=L0K819_HALHC|nr:hypothetical protein [Halobacteroides halobius]AGB40499.1 hypothetical protein Halha_0525 [Halobacteroides halobius DSM 5150]